MEVHRSALLIDTHNNVNGKTVDGYDIGTPSERGQTDLARLRAGGVGAMFFAIFVPYTMQKTNGSTHRGMEILDSIRHDIVEKYPRDFALALSADDIEAAHRDHKIAALIGMEGGHPIENSLRVLRDFYALGLRYLTLTHNITNDWADAGGDAGRHNGLSPFGKDVIREMNRLGMIVDISHVSEKTAWDAVELSAAPVLASHSSCFAICPHRSNLRDDLIQAMAAKGGLIQINFVCQMLSEGTATVASVADHIDYVKKIAGIGAVGIGSDFDGTKCLPKGLEDVSKYSNLTRELLQRGYTAEQIRQIYGGNVLRLMRQVEKVAVGQTSRSARVLQDPL